MINCHFVSRFATRPWEFGQRRLWYFDFQSRRIAEASSESLFTVVGENSQEVETRLNALVESPISAEVARWERGTPPAADLHWQLFRAVALLLLIQPIRSADDPNRSATLEEIVLRPDTELDELARAAEARYQLARISVRPDAAVLYPSAGWFPLPAQNTQGQWVMSPAIPVGLTHVMVAVDRELNVDQVTDMWRANGSGRIANLSVGHNSNRVVLPPGHKAATADDQIVQTLEQLRCESLGFVDLMRQANQLRADFDAMP